jgi:hypothetical protein
LKEAAVGLEADLPECGQVAQAFSDVEVARIGGLGSQRLTFLVVLLDARALIAVEIQRVRGRSFVNDCLG